MDSHLLGRVGLLLFLVSVALGLIGGALAVFWRSETADRRLAMALMSVPAILAGLFIAYSIYRLLTSDEAWWT